MIMTERNFVLVLWILYERSYFLNPIWTMGGGGGLFGPDHQIINLSSKTALSSTSKLGNILFLFIGHILAEF